MNLKKLLKRNSLVVGIALFGLVEKAVYEEKYSDRADNVEDFIKIIKQEQPRLVKLGDRKTILCGYGWTPWGTAGSMKVAEGKYKLILGGKRNRAAIRHELYHIYSGHCDVRFEKNDWPIKDKIHDELTANIYSYFGIRL